jgi:cobalt/nickel transport system permease protein
MHLEVFAEGDSILHKLDPRVKIFVLFIFAVLCAISKGLLVPSLFLLFSLILILIARPDFKTLLNRVGSANFFILFIWLFVPFTYKSSPYVNLGFLKISYPGIKYALSITLKCNAIILATIALLATSTVFNLAHAMLHLKVPAKLVTIFFLFYRYITVMHEEYIKIKRAVLARGFNSKTSMHTYKTYAYIVGALLLKSFERSEEVYKAMLCRGFKGFFPLLEHFKLKTCDIILGSIFTLCTVLIYLLQWIKI